MRLCNKNRQNTSRIQFIQFNLLHALRHILYDMGDLSALLQRLPISYKMCFKACRTQIRIKNHLRASEVGRGEGGLEE